MGWLGPITVTSFLIKNFILCSSFLNLL
uniref:Uncharacterized protein n=1 Tax=Rhizophora mucronata TaxID=61149 RepID=A0A2P2PSN3_RHIMU